MEDENDKKSKGQRSKRYKDPIKAKLAWLQEGADDIVDFLAFFRRLLVFNWQIGQTVLH
jgi:hypothetical protein